jgi:uncharacterized protein (TIRG00374 family)
MRQRLFILASIAVSVIFMALVLRDVPLAQVMERIQQINLFWLAICFVFVGLALWTRMIRWRLLLPGYPLPANKAFHIINITFGLNLLPLRAGEVARSLLATRYGVPLMTAATSVIVERLLDVLLVVVLLTGILTQIPGIPPETGRVALFFGIAGFSGFIVLLFFAAFPNVAHRLLAILFRLLPFLRRWQPQLENLLEQIIEGLHPLTSWRKLLPVVIWTLIAWLASLASLYSLHLALNIQNVNLILSTALGVALASFSIAIPVSIASIGPFQAAIELTGRLVGMERVDSVSLGLIYHAFTSLCYLFWTILAFLDLGISIGDVLKQKRPPAEDAPATTN